MQNSGPHHMMIMSFVNTAIKGIIYFMSLK